MLSDALRAHRNQRRSQPSTGFSASAPGLVGSTAWWTSTTVLVDQSGVADHVGVTGRSSYPRCGKVGIPIRPCCRLSALF